MVFSIIIVVLVGAVAFFHYTQGFWSATLSAIITVIAAVVAVGYHESVVDSLLKGKMSDQANAIALVGLFGLTYIILRVISDKAIPGNLRLPVILDKVGAGIMGFFAAIFSVGVLAVAAQTLPFGPGVAGYVRYPLTEDREVAINIPGRSQQQEIPINDQLEPDTFAPEDRKGLWIPVDDWTVGLVSHLSDGGSLAGNRTLKSVHPNYLDELFGQRLGIQPGATHVATNAVKKQVDIKGIFRAPGPLPQIDGDLVSSRPHNKPVKAPEPKNGESLIVVRVLFNNGTADSGKAPEFVRFSMGSIRLVTNSEEEGSKNYYPVGTVENGTTLLASRMDDFLFATEGQSADVAFVVPNSEIFEGGGKVVEGKPLKIKDGVFIEVKRLAREALGGKTVEEGIKAEKGVSVLRKNQIYEALKNPAPAPAAAAPAAPGAAAAPADNAAPATPPAAAAGTPTPPKRAPKPPAAK